MSPSTSWRTAPAGSICCPICHRYLPEEKIGPDSRCLDRKRCLKAMSRFLGLPRRGPKVKGPM